ncbi:MAG: HesA/MoeB/ThiF family protein [Clostridia bacterium]|nr:HesA/MoeB/ThiF family protein [Clostridia bacterium]
MRVPILHAPLTESQKERYKRHICLAHVGEAGVEKIRAARVLIVGAGGLGSPIALYLAAAGVGVIGLVDSDTVELSNLQRQIIHSMPDIGRAKVESAAEKMRRLNPDVLVEEHRVALNAANAVELVNGYDVAVDALDNLETRFILSDACGACGKPFVHGAVLGWMGQAMTFLPGQGPCYRCVFGGGAHERLGADEDLGPLNPARAGVLSSAPGVIGAVEATEVLKLITGVGEPLIGRLLLWDAQCMAFDEVRVLRDPECHACGHHD